MNDVDKRLEFLYSTAQKMSYSDHISSHLIRKYMHLAAEENYQIPTKTLKTFCLKCGSIFKHPQNYNITTVEIVREKTFILPTRRRISKNDPIASHTLIKCSKCKITTQIYGPTKSELEKFETKKREGENKKGKKKKKNDLAKLIGKKAGEHQQYSLNDFLAHL